MKMAGALVVAGCLLVAAGPTCAQDTNALWKVYLRIAGEFMGRDVRPTRSIQESFDVSKPDVSAFLLGRLNDEDRISSGRNLADIVLYLILDADVVKGMTWILDHYAEFSGLARIDVANALRRLPLGDPWRLVRAMLKDNTVVLMKASPLDGGDYRTRVSDRAYDGLRFELYRAKKQPGGPLGLPSSRYTGGQWTDNDRHVQALAAWWDANEATLLANVPRLKDKDPELAKRLDAFLATLMKP
jgi:hypothetical protein